MLSCEGVIALVGASWLSHGFLTVTVLLVVIVIVTSVLVVIVVITVVLNIPIILLLGVALVLLHVVSNSYVGFTSCYRKCCYCFYY